MNEPELESRQKFSFKCSVNLKQKSLLEEIILPLSSVLLGIRCVGSSDTFWKDNCVKGRVLSREIQLFIGVPLIRPMFFFKQLY